MASSCMFFSEPNRGGGCPSAHLGTELHPGRSPPQLTVHWGVSGEVSGGLNLGSIGKCPVDTGEASRRGEGQGREGRREETAGHHCAVVGGRLEEQSNSLSKQRQAGSVTSRLCKQTPPISRRHTGLGSEEHRGGSRLWSSSAEGSSAPLRGEAVIGPQQWFCLPEGVWRQMAFSPPPTAPPVPSAPRPSLSWLQRCQGRGTMNG